MQIGNLNKIKYITPISLLSLSEKSQSINYKDRPDINDIVKILDNLDLEDTYQNKITKTYHCFLEKKVEIPTELKKLWDDMILENL